MTGLLDPRDETAALRELAAVARQHEVGIPGAADTWHDLLFTGDGLGDPSRPDQALLAAVARLTAGLARHLNQVPARLHQQWLAEILGIPRAGAVPDGVPLGFTRAPGTAEVLVPDGTEVRAKDGAGRDRRYLVTGPVQVHGTSVPVVRASRALRSVGGGVHDRAVEWTDRETSFDTFRTAPGAAGALSAPHRLRIADPRLATDGSGERTSVRLGFVDGEAGLLAAVQWHRSTQDGPAPAAVVGGVTRNEATTSITVEFSGACAPGPGDALPWLEASLPTGSAPLDAAASSMTFTNATVQVTVKGLAPQAAFADDARLDLAKAFEPFGPVPREGATLVVQSDEALGKPLVWIGVDIGRPGAATKDQPGAFGPAVTNTKGQSAKKSMKKLGTASKPSVVLETWTGTGWGTATSPSSTADVLENMGGVFTAAGTASASAAIGYAGRHGHFLRLRLDDGDFGWQDFQAALGELAAAAGTDAARPSASRLVPPLAPRLDRLRLTYITTRSSAAQVTAYDGFGVRRQTGSGDFAAFTSAAPLGSADDVGTLDLAVDLPDTALGGSMSVWFEVDPADVGAAPGVSEWLLSADHGWLAADVSDGTTGLRQSGLLRVLAPTGWARGAADAGDPDGEHRWLRLRSTEPGRLGRLRAVVPDAALAVQAARPSPVAPDQALEAGQVKGVVSPVDGLRRVSGLRGVPGRLPESDEDYRRRGSGHVRHRERAVQAWDYEELARDAVPGLAAVRCLPHTCAMLASRPGSVALVVVPRDSRAQPVPTVAMAERIEAVLRPRMPLTATLAVVPAAYVAVSVAAHLVLVPGVPALQGRAAVLGELERWLHPAQARRPRFGGGLYSSAVVSFLESLPVVDHVDAFGLGLPDGTSADPVTVDPLRGLVASSGEHVVTVEESL